MYLKFLKNIVVLIILIGLFSSCSQLSNDDFYDQLKVDYEGDAKIEVGGPYAGIEIHHSTPLLQRISLFYPVANSIDLSTDYWTRDTSHIMMLGLKIDDGAKELIGLEPMEFTLTPYNVVFNHADSLYEIKVKYEFCKSKPAMVITYELTNTSKEKRQLEFYTGFETTLRTCHTYSIKDKASTEYDKNTSTIFANFDDPETGNVQLFVSNVGEHPSSFDTRSNSPEFSIVDNSWLNSIKTSLEERTIPKSEAAKPAAKFLYIKELESGKTLEVVQVIGTCEQGKAKELVKDLQQNYQEEIDAFEKYVLSDAFENKFTTNDKWLDKTYNWARGVLAVNKHYLDGDILPMPCPAEYNFYFTHDVLVTDLSAVNYDLERVKSDLQFLKKHSNKDDVIPHAYYWKDNKYVTEYSALDSWNHFWFIIASASYLRHSSDVGLLAQLYPNITKSLEQTLTNKMDDDLLWAYRPEGWDIGSSFGPRSYMTILAIRAIRDYLFISTSLNLNDDKMVYYQDLAQRMNEQLIAKLWSEEQSYLINYYEDGSIDKHYYVGSLLAAHFGLLDEQKLKAMEESATKNLVDRKLGVYNVYPMDFHLLIDFLKFKGNEAGDPFLYANGGIWPQASVWYSMLLKATGQKEKAVEFIHDVLTIDGLLNSPNGQPAMYEYRCGNYNDSTVYGTIDKPQFMWAAGWYIYSLYHLFGTNENEWNISFDPYIFNRSEGTKFPLYINGKLADVNIYGKGKYIRSIKFDDEAAWSTIVPFKYMGIKNIDIELGEVMEPYLKNVNSVVRSVTYDRNAKEMKIELSAFDGHKSEIEIVSPFELGSIEFENDIKIIDQKNVVDENHFITKVKFVQMEKEAAIVFRYK